MKQEVCNVRRFMHGIWLRVQKYTVINRGTVVVSILWKGARVTHCNYGPVVHTQQSLCSLVESIKHIAHSVKNDQV
jgi:hypothetical protein